MLGQRVAVTPGFVVGGAPSRAHVLPSSASRSICIIEQRAKGWCVRDLGSMAGVFYNGAPLASVGVELLHQDVLEFLPGLPFVFLLREKAPQARNEQLEACDRGRPRRCDPLAGVRRLAARATESHR